MTTQTPTDTRQTVHNATQPTTAAQSTPAMDVFADRHIGPNPAEISEMLRVVGCETLDELIDQTVPDSIRTEQPLTLSHGATTPRSEFQALADIAAMAEQNQIYRSLIGMGYYGTITPPVIQRNILENPGWYTQYTPYQAEIAQGRLEALLNFQTMVSDLTGLPLANASLLDEATAAAEAMSMCVSITNRQRFIIASDCHPQTLAVVRTRARSLGIDLLVADPADLESMTYDDAAGVLVQYPATDGRIVDYTSVIEKAHASGALAVMAADLLALTLIKSPGEFGADIAVGSTQRFGVPMGYGGPHAAYMATLEKYVRRMPGRIIGVSRDVHGNNAYRMAIQTREQHIKRDRATSNICTAQVLLAIMAGMYAVYHGPNGLTRIARHVHSLTRALAHGLRTLGHNLPDEPFFDTLKVQPNGITSQQIHEAAAQHRINLRNYTDGSVGISLDETCTIADVHQLLEIFGAKQEDLADITIEPTVEYHDALQRTSDFLTHPVFNTYHTETKLLRYMHTLQSRDLSLTHSMIPLGSCTMKLNATAEMIPITWPGFANLHPYAPLQQAQGYLQLFRQLEDWLAEMTGFAAVSLQPNAGSQGEYAGLLAIRAYHESRDQGHRNICLIPASAHGTNPASAVIAGFRVVAVACDENGNIDIQDLRAKAQQHADDLGAVMITYPSTHGVFEPGIREMCEIVHTHGGQVYLDGANLNAQLGLAKPGQYGADVCHLNLHKTFCIPHGGGGPGMGPIAVAEHLKPFLPADPLSENGESQSFGPVSAANYSSASILPISWMYIAMMGAQGLTQASKIAILSANYMAKRLEGQYDVLYTGVSGRVAHEFILDCRAFDKSADIKVEDIAKRLMDYGFHGPTMSWPVPGTLMIEPTESESKDELDRFCDAMIAIREEIRAIEQGNADRADNLLKNAPHTAAALITDDWPHPYPRQQAAYPMPWLREHKFWPAVGRIDQAYGDRNLMCSCPPWN